MARRCLLAPLALAFALVALPLAGASAQTAQGGTGAKQLVAPPKMWAAQVSPTEITLTWSGVAGALGYEILMRDAKGATVRLGETSASGRRYVVPVARLGGAASQVAAFAVRALGSGRVPGMLGWFNPVSPAKAGTGKGAAAPGNVRVVESMPGVVTLTWDEVDGATAYAIGRSKGTSGLQRLCDICPTGGRFVDTVPEVGVRYFYRITGLTPSGATRSTISDSIVPTGVIVAGGGTGDGTGATPAGTADADLKGHAEGVTITANPLPGAPRTIRVLVRKVTPLVQDITAMLMRQVCNGPLREVRRIADNAPFQLDDALGGLDFPECNGLSKMAVRYVVRISDPKGLAANSKAAAVELPNDAVATAPPATPTNLRIARISDGSRTLTWDAVTGATSYRIERVVGAKGAWTLLREVDGAVKSYKDPQTLSETPRYRITAVNSAGSSAAGMFP